VDFLTEMAAKSRMRASQLLVSCDAMRESIEKSPAPPGIHLSVDGFDLIAEYKRQSPSQGNLTGSESDLDDRVSSYQKGGAAMISVLTEPDFFGGSLSHLSRAAKLMRERGIPVMRKDFLVDPLQVDEARAAGAGGVLLIIRMLDDDTLEKMLDCADGHGMLVLAEAFDRLDLERLAEVSVTRTGQPILAGINCRDLKSLQIKPEQFFELAPFLPPGLAAVAESGISSATILPALADAGYRLALIGGALMQHGAPRDFVASCLVEARGKATGKPGAG